MPIGKGHGPWPTTKGKDQAKKLKIPKEALRIANTNLESIPTPAGEMPVILGPGWPGVMLHEAVGHGLEGDFNRKGTSIFSGKIGEKVTADGVTVIDDGTIENKRGSITFSRDLAKTSPNIGSKVLLVDDLADSGITLKKSIEWMEHFYGFYLDEPIRTGVLFYKSVSKFKPNYFIDYLEDSPWIHMPYEKYESLKPEDIIKK